jgi:hypothetical protein
VDTSQQELERTQAPQDQMRCPSCGGLNRAGADWCGQCLRRFTAPPAPAPVHETVAEAPAETPAPVVPAPVAEAPVAPAPVPAPSADTSRYAAYIDDARAAEVAPSPAPTAPDDAPAAKTPPPEAVGTERGAFKVTPEGIVWTCKSCDTENPLALQTCSVCGTQFANTLRDDEPKHQERDPGTVAMLSLFMPGAGHAYMGMWGQAIARGILQLWVLFTALMGALQKGGSNVIVIVFGMASMVLWMLAAHDAYREASHEPKSVILKGRAFMYVVLGLLFLLIVLLMGAGLKANG